MMDKDSIKSMVIKVRKDGILILESIFSLK